MRILVSLVITKIIYSNETSDFKSSNYSSFNVLGYYMFTQNILAPNYDKKDYGPIATRIAEELVRVYPGIGVEPIRANKPGFRMFPGAGPVVHCRCNACF